MKALCMFYGSGPGLRQEFACAAQELSQELARQNIGLV